jgi:hypothetical protein
MKKILLLVSSFLIICMAGTAMCGSCTLLYAVNNSEISGDLTLAKGDTLDVKLKIGNIGDRDLEYPWTIKSLVQPLPSSTNPVGNAGDIDVDIVGTNPFNLPSKATYFPDAVISITMMDSAPDKASYKVEIGAYYDTTGGTSYTIQYGEIQLAAASENVTAAVPEFPTIALPVAALIGLVFIFGRKKEEM